MNASPELLAKLAGRRVVASISGGKDSAALSLHLRELGIEHERVFMDTGWEHPATYEYLRGELTRALGPILELKPEVPMRDLILFKKMAFPWGRVRFCTEHLKVFPMQRHLNALVEQGHDVVNAVGIRRDESQAREDALEWEWNRGFDCETWRPLVAWSQADVIAIHQRNGLRPNPLYLQGAARVGCWPCIHASKADIRRVADTDPARIDTIREMEQHLTAKAGAPRTFFKPGTIDEVVDWARTSRGGKQFEMFAAAGRDQGCMRWGLCDTGSAPAANSSDDEKGAA